MKTIKVAFYKVEVLKSKNQRSLPLYHFQDLLKDLASKLDGNTNRQVIEISTNGLETSIWFDYLNDPRYFNLKDKVYFLLAKDVKSIMKEDKKNNKLSQEESIKNDIHLKIPSHFVYFPEKDILGVEELDNAPTKSIIKRAIREHTNINVSFDPINRTDIIERLQTFQKAIENVEFDLNDFSQFIKDAEPDEFINFVRTNHTTMRLKTFLETSKSKIYIVDLFSKILHNRTENEILNYISNIKISFKNESLRREAIELVDNFLVFKADRDMYIEDLCDIEDEVEKRRKYSKSIYESIIEFYDEYFN